MKDLDIVFKNDINSEAFYELINRVRNFLEQECDIPTDNFAICGNFNDEYFDEDEWNEEI